MRPALRPLLVAMLAGASACFGWVNQPVDPSDPPPASHEFQVWSRGTAYLVRDLRIDHDTLAGVLTRARRPTRSAFSIAMTEVDSIRVRPAIEVDAGLVFGVVMVALYAFLIHAGQGN